MIAVGTKTHDRVADIHGAVSKRVFSLKTNSCD